MSYSIKKGFENTNVGAKIFDGRKIFKGQLKNATQEELEQLHFMGVQCIEKSDSKPIIKMRDNSPNAAPVVVPPKRKKKKKKTNGIQKETDSKKDME
jgi:S-methylmethionine-dependent homocysteine/selenocysteine methylase